MRLLGGWTLFLLALASTACKTTQNSPSGPSTRDVESAVRRQLPTTHVGRIDFQRTDGVAGEVFGVKTYGIAFRVTMEIEDDLLYRVAQQSDVPSVHKVEVVDPTPEPGYFGPNISAFKGDRLVIDGETVHELHESGWVVVQLHFQQPTLDSSRRAPGHSPGDLLASRRAAAETKAREEMRQSNDRIWQLFSKGVVVEGTETDGRATYRFRMNLSVADPTALKLVGQNTWSSGNVGQVNGQIINGKAELSENVVGAEDKKPVHLRYAIYYDGGQLVGYWYVCCDGQTARRFEFTLTSR